MQFCKTGQSVVFIKIGTKHSSKGGIELAILKAFREVLIEVMSFRFRVAELVLVHFLVVLLVDGSSLVYIVIYDAHKQAHNQEKNKGFIVELESETIKFGDRDNISRRFSNGMAETILEMAW